MKLLYLILLIMSTCEAIAQGSVIYYMNSMPVPPANICSIDKEDMKGYYERLSDLKHKLNDEISMREDSVNKFMKRNKEAMKENALKDANFNLTPDQMQAMKKDKKNMSQEEKMKLADQIMQQNMNISMAEMQQRKKDSENKDSAALMRYSKAYATERMADMPPAETEKAKQEKLHTKADVGRKLAALQEKLFMQNIGIQQMIDSLQVESDTAFGELLRKEEPYKREMERVHEANRLDPDRKYNETAARADFETINQCVRDIQRLRYHYCFPLTPKYIEILNKIRLYLPTSFADLDEVDKLNNEMLFLQTGVKPPEEAIGLSALKAVNNYAAMLMKIDKYRIAENPDKENEAAESGEN